MSVDIIYNYLNESLDLLWGYVSKPYKRTYWLYLLSSFIIALGVYIKSKPGSFKAYFFNKQQWFGASAWVDYTMTFFNVLFKIIFIGPYLALSLYISVYFNEYLIELFGYSSITLTKTQTLLAYTLALTIIQDIGTYGVHWAFHKIPLLWHFHKVHHGATHLTPLTQYRIHPIELIVNNAKAIIIIGLVTGYMDYLSNYQISKIMFLGVNLFSFIFLFLGANLRHSHVRLSYPTWLEKIFISPFQHQIHHSDHPAHFNKNLGSKLAIWDWLFGTLVRSKEVGKIKFGIGQENKDFKSFWQNIYMPFKKLFSIFSTQL